MNISVLRVRWGIEELTLIMMGEFCITNTTYQDRVHSSTPMKTWTTSANSKSLPLRIGTRERLCIKSSDLKSNFSSDNKWNCPCMAKCKIEDKKCAKDCEKTCEKARQGKVFQITECWNMIRLIPFIWGVSTFECNLEKVKKVKMSSCWQRYAPQVRWVSSVLRVRSSVLVTWVWVALII